MRIGKKKILLSILLFVASFVSGCASKTIISNSSSDIAIIKDDDFYGHHLTGDGMNLSKAQKLYDSYFANISTIPISFTYNNTHYKGFRGFKIVSQETKADGDNSSLIIKLLHPDENLLATVESRMFNKYDGFEWTASFENIGKKNSAIIEDLASSELTIKGANPCIKNNLGDYTGLFAPVTYALKDESLVFKTITGRSTQEYMPYFNIETDEGGMMMAIGWGGTWKAEFLKNESGTKVKTENVIGLKTYLKPGEKIRTARMAFVVYETRNEDLAINKWRRWMINCNMPRDLDGQPVQPASAVAFLSDTEYGWYRGGSGDENLNTWRPSYDKLKEHNLTFDYHWFDAGWYSSPQGGTLAGNDWYPVGSWAIDQVKWPRNSLYQYLTTVKENLASKGSLMWFEIERFHGELADMRRWGANPEWFFPVQRGDYLLYLGEEEARDWIFDKITYALTASGASIYRQDHNFSPAPGFASGDMYQGENRIGISENLHFQGEYELWQRIIDWQVKHGRPSFIEGQSAGGNRQDIETLKYQVNFFRTDDDIRYNPPRTVSKINALNKWIPFGGPLFGQYEGTIDTNNRSKFHWRSTYSSMQMVCLQYQNMNDETWQLVEEGLEEFNKYKKYTYYDFYELTPWKPLAREDQWVARMYFDEQQDKGVLEVFNFAKTGQNKTIVKLKGLNPDHYYKLVDPDENNGIRLISGRTLLEGYDIYLSPNSSALLWIEPNK